MLSIFYHGRKSTVHYAWALFESDRRPYLPFLVGRLIAVVVPAGFMIGCPRPPRTVCALIYMHSISVPDTRTPENRYECVSGLKGNAIEDVFGTWAVEPGCLARD